MILIEIKIIIEPGVEIRGIQIDHDPVRIIEGEQFVISTGTQVEYGACFIGVSPHTEAIDLRGECRDREQSQN